MASYRPATWRLLNTGWQDGPTNMAIDEALAEAVAAGESPPTLRFYGWDPACLSLGYGQSWTVADWEECAGRGWDVVRRPTGGRAILHVDELTYSVCAPESERRVRGGVLESYQRLSAALAHGLKLLGVEPERAPRAGGPGGTKGPVCFDLPSSYEITVGGRKLVGSAQARRKGVVLQHGTLPLYGDIGRILHALCLEPPQERSHMVARLHQTATTLEASRGRRIEFDEAAAALRQGFSAALALTFEEKPLTAGEKARAQEIRSEKFGDDAWTKRV
ncbi:MAG: biotin/lipoate A/B protein ligase family protein [Candidatus Promineifilaceae bacterium]|nr:biotin/lipoate A/B protein ligase family protein [Candidatus Promineifilaceae bacterium]